MDEWWRYHTSWRRNIMSEKFWNININFISPLKRVWIEKIWKNLKPVSPSEDVGCFDFATWQADCKWLWRFWFFFNYNDSIELKNFEIYAQIFFKYNILSKTGVKGSSYIFINKRDYTSHKRPMINDVLSTINEWWFKRNWGMGSFFA